MKGWFHIGAFQSHYTRFLKNAVTDVALNLALDMYMCVWGGGRWGGLCPRVSLLSFSSMVHGLPQSQMSSLVACHVTFNQTNEHLPHACTAYFSIVRSKSWVSKGHFCSTISNSILLTNNYDQSLLFIPAKWTKHVKYLYMYSSPITSYIFRYLLHHLQGDHYVICLKTICFLQCCYKL
jgi:hypothetical protein